MPILEVLLEWKSWHVFSGVNYGFRIYKISFLSLKTQSNYMLFVLFVWFKIII